MSVVQWYLHLTILLPGHKDIIYAHSRVGTRLCCVVGVTSDGAHDKYTVRFYVFPSPPWGMLWLCFVCKVLLSADHRLLHHQNLLSKFFIIITTITTVNVMNYLCIRDI
jgi:hypothetical protein